MLKNWPLTTSIAIKLNAKIKNIALMLIVNGGALNANVRLWKLLMIFWAQNDWRSHSVDASYLYADAQIEFNLVSS